MGHIWLIGMTGTGKTSVGALVATGLQIPFVDVDALIVEHENRSIPEIFAEGEDVFRCLESREIAAVARNDAVVVATGGGAVLDPVNVQTMRSSGTIVLLSADIETLHLRLAGTTDRPLLDRPGALAALAAQRGAVYRHGADHVIDTTGLDIETVAREVVACAVT